MDWVSIATISSPALTLAVSIIGWLLIFKESKNSSKRSEVYDLLITIVKILTELNSLSAKNFFKEEGQETNAQIWLATVAIEISAMRNISSILKEVHSISVPDTFFYTIRRNFTLDAEIFHTYSKDQKIQKVSMQNSQTAKALVDIYKLYPR